MSHFHPQGTQGGRSSSGRSGCSTSSSTHPGCATRLPTHLPNPTHPLPTHTHTLPNPPTHQARPVRGLCVAAGGAALYAFQDGGDLLFWPAADGAPMGHAAIVACLPPSAAARCRGLACSGDGLKVALATDLGDLWWGQFDEVERFVPKKDEEPVEPGVPAPKRAEQWQARAGGGGWAVPLLLPNAAFTACSDAEFRRWRSDCVVVSFRSFYDR